MSNNNKDRRMKGGNGERADVPGGQPEQQQERAKERKWAWKSGMERAVGCPRKLVTCREAWGKEELSPCQVGGLKPLDSSDEGRPRRVLPRGSDGSDERDGRR